jgi:hypothetical protein
MKRKKVFRVIIIFSWLLLSGCPLFSPCTTTLTVINGNNGCDLFLINNQKNYFKFHINKNKKQFSDNDVMYNTKYIFIKDSNLEGIYEISEYDHYFSSKHDVKITLTDGKFIINKSGKKIYGYNNYETSDYANFGDFESFEDFKKFKYPDIYDIIKKK